MINNKQTSCYYQSTTIPPIFKFKTLFDTFSYTSTTIRHQQAMVQLSGSKRRHVSSSSSTNSNFKVKQQKITWEVKKQLAMNRISSLDEELGKGNGEGESAKQGMQKPMPMALSEIKTTPELLSCKNNDVMDRAKRIQSNLPTCFPTFLKPMLKSHVSGGFWLGLPRKFCVEHLPKGDAAMVLVDEHKQEYIAKYLAEKNGLSGGWRGFSIAHKLVNGDVLIFQLISPLKFKMYIIRAGGLPEVEPCQNARSQVDNQIIGAKIENQSEGEFNSAESQPSLEQMTSFNDFTIHMDGLIIESELPMHLRRNYYELCRSQNNILHDNLVKGLNAKLLAGVISETAGISSAIRGVKSVSDTDRLESWDKTLKAFEDLGMQVGFMRRRIRTLLGLVRESQGVIESKEAERGDFESKLRDLRTEVLRVEVAIKCLDDEIRILKTRNKKLDFVFREVAGSPW